ncbi:hypothetical protein [Streptomyces montanisoli]|uniref:Uncharacterized protein n=1 Tax=Streptomyces montanisoli TaxID=2798581 RepID=A0A940RV62_9ACTN|nr:hypothetical protein [Streptomyces montanisoli]MBP0458707.1 hypothetical protein [Streptomyces montanisoli]
MADTFYKHGRPQHPTLEEDRPRGGRAKGVKHQGSWSVGAIILVIVLLVIVGIALFP